VTLTLHDAEIFDEVSVLEQSASKSFGRVVVVC
jgi:hypothetical protein